MEMHVGWDLSSDAAVAFYKGATRKKMFLRQEPTDKSPTDFEIGEVMPLDALAEFADRPIGFRVSLPHLNNRRVEYVDDATFQRMTEESAIRLFGTIEDQADLPSNIEIVAFKRIKTGWERIE